MEVLEATVRISIELGSRSIPRPVHHSINGITESRKSHMQANQETQAPTGK